MSLYDNLLESVIYEDSVEEYKERIRILREGKIKDYINNKGYNHIINSLNSYSVARLKEINNNLKYQKDNYIKTYGTEKYKKLCDEVEKTIISKDSSYKNEIEKRKEQDELERLKKDYKNKKDTFFKNSKINIDSNEYDNYCKKAWPIIEKVISKYLSLYNNDDSIKKKYKDTLTKFYPDEPSMIKNPKFKLSLIDDNGNQDKIYQLINGNQEENIATISAIEKRLTKDLYKDPILKSNNIYFDFKFGDGDEGCIYINF